MQKFKFCPDCGAMLSRRDLGDETGVPWCDVCSRPWFPMFPVATISLVYNDRGEVLLLRQEYISKIFCNLVSGYVTPGESAEECAVREILEETGITVDRVELKCTSWFAKKGILMVGFFAHAPHTELRLSSEVDDAFWVAGDKALSMVSDRPGSTSRLLVDTFLNERRESGFSPGV